MSIDTRRAPDPLIGESRDGPGPSVAIATDPIDTRLEAHDPPGRWHDLLRRVWGDRRTAVVGAVVLAVGWGALAGWWMPRGPLTTTQSLGSIAISVVVGAAAGFMTRSRWMIFAAPVAFAAMFEIVRAGTDGPTVDGIHLSTYGVMALVVGRGFHALVSLFPMMWGAALGTGVARLVERRLQPPLIDGRRFGRLARRSVAALAGVGLFLFSLALARPARTDAIVDADGNTVAGSIAELVTVDVNGHDLGMMIRGHSADAPVLLFLAGGPGGSELGAMRNHLPELEEHFVVATWDQRGTGTSYPALDPTSTYTLDAAVDDTIAVTEYLRSRFGDEQVYLAGQSWGSILGVLAVQQRPELYRTFVGVGQMVSPLATDRIFYDDTLAWARANGDTGLAERLVEIGAPPYADMLDYETALSYEHEIYPYDHSTNSEGEGGFSENFLVEEYTLTQQVHLLAGFMDTFGVIYPQIQGVDFRVDAPQLDVPVYFVQGVHEAPGRSEPFAEWYEALDAPAKQLVTFDTSGHRPLFEQPDEFVAFMSETVLAETSES